MSNEQLQAARAYIESGDYEAAKTILEKMPDNQTAQKWLVRLIGMAQMPTQRWEYCLLGSVVHAHSDGHIQTGDTVIVHFSPDGEHKIRSKVDVPTAIAQLGERGWEMVATGAGFAVTTLTGSNGIPGHVLYFKRPLRD